MRINEKLMKALKFIGAAAAFAVVIPFVSANASVVARDVGDFTISAIDSLTEGTDYSYENGVLTIKSDKAITIENTNRSTATKDRIVIDIGAAANITLAGVNIETDAGAALEIAEDNNNPIKITLADSTTNTLKTTSYGCAGLQKNELASHFLTIEAQQKGTGKLIAQGGENAAGIGGGERHSSMHIRINGGIIEATGGENGAGIGGGKGKDGSSISISGGSVTATGGNNGAGIGGGNSGEGSIITILGGEVTANGGSGAAGIGGGNSGSCEDIYIISGVVTATGKNGGAGIGGGGGGECSSIYIYDGKVNATGGSGGAGIGGGTNGKGSNIEINGGDVTATGGTGGAGIGGGNNGEGSNIEISAGKVNANGGDGGAGIGGGESGKGSIIKIKDGKVNATGGENGTGIGGGAGIGGGSGGEGNGIYIDDGEVTAKGGDGGAGIGGGSYGKGSYIQIKKGTVNATGGDYAAGIGGGNGEEGSNIEINGGDVTSNGGERGGAGIGGGNGKDGSNIKITNGTVNATGGEGAAGIGGGGNGGTGSNINISGGNVTAEGKYGGAGIGGGGNGGGGNRGVAKDVKISGGSVKASGATPIGSGSSAESSPLPTNGSGKNVYLYEIDNQSSADITIDGNAYPSAHGTENKIYAYLSEGETHTIKVGDKTTYVKYNNGKFEETTAPSSSTPSRPSRPKPEPVDNPIIGGEEKSWNSVAKEISALSEGEETTIDLNGATKVPADVIKAIKDSKAVVTFKAASAFGWTIDGSKLTDSDIADIDFEINLITATGTETLRGTVGTGFAIDSITDKAALSISFKQNHAGKFANLYKIVDEKLVFADNVRIDENGEANGLTVYEKGEYVVMLGEMSDRPGDMNSDGILNAKDALAVLKHSSKLEQGKNPAVSDVNGDGLINAKDALFILKKAAGIAV